MKDHSASSHSLVAQNRKLQAPAAQEDSGGGSDYNLQCDSSFSDDNDWDSGKLVIDLDVDTNKSPQKTVQGTPKKSAVVALSRSPAKKSVSNMEHMQATVDKGLKMKIKRSKNAGAKSDTKSHEIVRNDPRSTQLDSTSLGNSPTVSLEKMKTGCEKDKVPKGRTNQKDKKGKERLAKQSSEPGVSNTSGPSVSGVGSSHGASGSDTKTSQLDSGKGSTASAPDPYEFNAKVEDRIGLPHVKKMKIEKVEVPPVSACSKSPGGEHRDMGVETCSQYVMTDPDCLGPCEPGTSVTLEGIVWQETENGMLVVNVTWRGKTFVGTLLDATKHDWAPPRLSCDSPTAEMETRTPKGRGKRGRGAAQAPLHDVSNTDRRNLRKGRRRNSGASTSTFQAPPSPAKVEVGMKRRRPADLDLESAKRSRSGSSTRSSPSSTHDDSPQLIECPEPNCSKKYRHINGLRYHQSHAHQNSVIGIDDNGQVIKEERMDTSPSVPEKPAPKNNKEKEETATKPKVEVEKVEKEPPKEKTKPEKTTKGKGKKGSKQDKESKESKAAKAEEANSNTTTNSKSGAQAKGASADGKATSQDSKKPAPQAETKTKNSAPQAESKPSTESTKPASSNSDAKVAPEKDTSLPNDGKASSDNSPATEPSPSSQPEIKSAQSTVISNTVTSVSKNVGVTYQITGPTIGCVGGITVVSGSGQTVGTTMGINAKVGGGPLGMRTNIATMSGMPVATVVTATTVDIPKADDKVKKSKPEKPEKTKAKGTTANRPIVPAPMTLAQGGLATVTTHAQVSPISSTASTLKPIQPKPTIMGEPTNINPALTSLKEKKSKKKKKDKEVKDPKDLPKDLSKSSVNSSVLPLTMHKQTKEAHSKAESTSVIKAAPSTGLGTPTRGLGTDIGKVEPERNIPAARSLLNPVNPVKDRPEGPPQLQHQLQGKAALPSTPGSIDLKSAVAQNVPVPVVEDSVDRENSSDVHSPAYSDISDANDSAPTLESETDKVEAPGQPETVTDKSQKQDMSRFGQMYPYYSQPPYLVPAVQPSGSKPGECTPSAIKTTPKKPEGGNEPNPAPTQKEVDLRDQKREVEQVPSASPAVSKPGPTVPPTPQSPSDYQMQQQRLQQQIYHQLHYVYKMPPDQAYHMTLIQSDPQYRAQYMKEQQSRAEKADAEKGGEKKREVSETVSRPPPEPQNLQQRPRDSPAAKVAEAKPDNKPPALISDRDRADKERIQREREAEQNLKEKQHENHQILKENIELKAQMERPARYDPLYVRRQEDIHRYQLLCQQQQKLQQQRVDDAKPIDARKQPIPSRSSTPEALVVPKEKPHADIRQELALRTRSPSTGPQGPKDLSSPKTALEKSRTEDKLPSASPRTTPKPKESPIPTSSSIPTVSQASYAQYMAHPYYASQVPYDAGPVYRAPMMGYPGAAYLHPTQSLRYMPPNEPGMEKEKSTVSPNTAPQNPEAQSKEPIQAHGPHFYNQGNTPHKIHELKEVGKGDHASPGKPGAEVDRQSSPFTKQGEHGGSPPTQRHLHSHHHTHVVTPGYPIYDPYSFR